jgi:hypothetical protein
MSAPATVSDSFRSATRVQESLLARVKTRTLIWLAQRLPGWVNSDHLTPLALAAMLAAGVSFWLAAVSRHVPDELLQGGSDRIAHPACRGRDRLALAADARSSSGSA